MCVMWNSAVKGQILKNQAVTEVLNLEHYIHPWKIVLKTKVVEALFKTSDLSFYLIKYKWLIAI